MPEKSDSVEYRVSNTTAGFIIAVALLCDGAQFLLNFIPAIGQMLSWLITFSALAVFALWFALLGISYFSGKKASSKVLSLLSATVVEMVPIINAVPAITMGVIGVIVASRAEDVEKHRETLKNGEGANASVLKPFKIPRVQQLRAANDDVEEDGQREAA